MRGPNRSCSPKQSSTSPSGAKSDGPSSPSQQIDTHIQHLNDWRGETLARVRALIRQAVPDGGEAVKWRGVPVQSSAGIICKAETTKSAVTPAFAKGAALPDPSRLFNASLEGNARRAIDLHEGAALDEDAFKTLIRAAASRNASKPAKGPARTKP